MYKHHYTQFLSGHGSILHFAAHSHHLWPDASRVGHMAAWDDAAQYSDRKWERIFTHIIPKAQRHVAKRLGVSDPSRIVFGGSTHELVFRLISCFDGFRKSYKILTTDSEFHSFSRQIRRLQEEGLTQIVVVPVSPIESFKQRFSSTAKEHSPDLIYFSHVFFNTGLIVSSANEFADMLSEDSHTPRTIVIDGYHGFCALPELFPLNDECVFYTAGGYKYAQSGEGCAFLCIPEGCSLRPVYTGWFADRASLEGNGVKQGVVQYGNKAQGFMGSTFDPTGLYRMNAVMDWMDQEGLTPHVIHDYILFLQDYFLKEIQNAGLAIFHPNNITAPLKRHRAHFLSFQTSVAKDVCATLHDLRVVVDARGDYLRIGFGLYHDTHDIDTLIRTLKKAEKQIGG